jgi:apolipoprotein N-acyltransferase
MVPMLLALKQVRSFRGFLGRVYLATLVGWTFGESWLLVSHAWGTMILFSFTAAVSAVPFVCFYFIRRTLGWRTALWSAPVVWTAWDWLYHLSEGSFGWLTMGLTQSNLHWLVQYVDITGVWGITFWLVLFNVLVVMAVEEYRIPDSGFRIEKRAAFARRLALVAAAMILPTVVYAAVAFSRETRLAANQRSISALMVQPNVDPWQKSDQSAVTLARAAALTDDALAGRKPDLIVWPETAVPYVMSRDRVARDFVYRAVSRWGTPLLTGTLDLQLSGQKGQHPGAAEQRDYRLLNAAVLLTPEPEKSETHLTPIGSLNTDRSGASQPRADHGPRERRLSPEGRFQYVKASEMYYKRRLFPMVETVPFQDRFPALSRLLVHIASGGGFEAGEDPTVFSLRATDGEPVTLAAPICYEQLYPAKIADLVRNGAQMLALITNEGWWSRTSGGYSLAAFTRLRAIETRRTVARTANTDVTCFIDPLGRIYGEALWWSQQTVLGNARLANEMSLYVRYTDYFPKACAWLSLALAVIVAGQTARQALHWRKPKAVVPQQPAAQRG